MEEGDKKFEVRELGLGVSEELREKTSLKVMKKAEWLLREALDAKALTLAS